MICNCKPYPTRAQQTPAWSWEHQSHHAIANKAAKHGSQHSSTEANAPIFCIPLQNTYSSSQGFSHTPSSSLLTSQQHPCSSSAWKSDTKKLLNHTIITPSNYPRELNSAGRDIAYYMSEPYPTSPQLNCVNSSQATRPKKKKNTPSNSVSEDIFTTKIKNKNKQNCLHNFCSFYLICFFETGSGGTSWGVGGSTLPSSERSKPWSSNWGIGSRRISSRNLW